MLSVGSPGPSHRAHRGDEKAGKPSQAFEGQITAGTPNCTGHVPVGMIEAGISAGQEVTHYEFEVDKATWQRPFVLEVTGGTDLTGIDLAIAYYLTYPPATEVLDNGAIVVFDGTAPDGGEKGVVPAKAVKALILLCQAGFINPGDVPTVGIQTSFSYLAQGKKQAFFAEAD